MNARRGFAVVGLFVVGGVIFFGRGRDVDDATLARALVGDWPAVDPSDAMLHRRELPVAREHLAIRADGTLTHVIELESKPGNPEEDLWGWKVSKGRLYLRYLGDDASGQWLPGIALSVSDSEMSIQVKGRLPKKWVRR